MGNKQKGFGKKKHQNFKVAMQKRMNKAITDNRVVEAVVELLQNASSTSPTANNIMLSENVESDVAVVINNEEAIMGEDIVFEEDLIDVEEDGDEETVQNNIPRGRRIVDINHFFESVRNLNSHNSNESCNFSNMRLVKEFRHGLNSTFTFTCESCQYTGVIKSNPTSMQELEINYASVLGAYAVGVGYYQSQEFFGALEVPFMAVGTYDKRQKLVQSDLGELSEKLEKEAMIREIQIATERNEVDVNGTPLLSMLADGSYPKRSYRTHYDSLSGTACLIGLHTKKIVWHGVKNKYCRTCALSKKEEPKEHICNRNYVGPSTGIESKLLLEAFRNSESQHGVRYHKLIADGDSKTYKVIDEAKIYRNPTLKIEKIECVLHLYRCAYGLLLKVKGLSSAQVEQLIIGIKSSVKHWVESDLSKSDKIENIRKDILNAPHHIFGDHSKCHQYFCDKEKHKDDVNEIPEMKKKGIYNNVIQALGRLLENAVSLLHGLNTNFPEQYNSIICKHLGGKRCNFCTGGSYKGRSDAASISFNTGRLVSEIRKFHLNEVELNANTIIYKIETTRLKKREMPVRPSYRRKVCLPDKNYGTDTCQRPDMSPEVFEILKNTHLDFLKEQQKDRVKIERETMEKANNNLREQIQEDVLTAKIFGKICRVTDKANYAHLVKPIRYTSESTGNTKEIKHGQIFENTAMEQLSAMLSVNIRNCGIFIDKNYEFLGANPTGLIDDNGIVQIKCPHSAFKMDINAAVANRKVTFWTLSRKRKNSEENEVKQIVGINKKHEWYFEIQGLLHVTQREYCIFAVWTGNDEISKCLKYERIYADTTFWETQMDQKLFYFFHNELLPEVIDPRKERDMPIRGTSEVPSKEEEINDRGEVQSEDEV